MKKETKLNILAIVIFIGLLFVFNKTFDSYKIRILNLCAIYIVLGLSMNLINGFTGLFTLGHAGFMAVGAYTSALLTMSPAMKEMNFFLKPIVPWLANVEWPFLPALIMAGVMAGIVGFLIGAPILKLRDDYLAIATLGFGEILRVIFTNTQSLTNGALGLKSVPNYTNVWWSFGTAIFTIIFMVFLIKGSYGRALKAIREDEIAAEAMGINLFKHKVMSFVMGAFFAGVGGALLGNLLGTIDPMMFRFILTFNILLIVVLGGIGSITGTVISAVVVTVAMEGLRVLDGDIDIGSFHIEGIPGMRMVVFSVLLMLVILFYNQGLMGTNELTWNRILGKKRLQKSLERQVK
ncbi:branched-chain amino acid ABC transporter permease [Crassaminicella profunda]|uniref:branched-chain amino acid ABC transporter permease n=1 Tax=Crassaminicella profunda TaxID=1286698 RepID=UPI001CA6080F|nr:branched-chain amino acid ABC transporter permease [Crassaminicella profunda]QZY55042.1 branched-chain amino acid ABC transporter permease [Crassaminicella profunda]